MVVHEFALVLVLFIGIMAFASLAFGGWIVLSVLRGLGNALFGSGRTVQRMAPRAGRPPGMQPLPPVSNFGTPSGHSTPPPVPGFAVTGAPGYGTPVRGVSAAVGSSNPASAGAHFGVPCQGPGCQQVNPAEARFCRRCGHPISQFTAQARRRAATW